MLRLVTYHTPSHYDMCRRFVLSRADEFAEVVASSYSQTCLTGTFKESGWNTCMLDKLDCLLSLPCDGKPTVYVDSDVAILPGFAAWCASVLSSMPADGVAFADDVVQVCAGVMLFRATPTVHSWWRLLSLMSPVWNLPDQDVIHHLRHQVKQSGGELPVAILQLPGNVVCNWATVNAPQIPAAWTGQQFVVPDTCLAWHGNWVVGIDLKTQMLERVVSRKTSAETPQPS